MHKHIFTITTTKIANTCLKKKYKYSIFSNRLQRFSSNVHPKKSSLLELFQKLLVFFSSRDAVKRLKVHECSVQLNYRRTELAKMTWKSAQPLDCNVAPPVNLRLSYEFGFIYVWKEKLPFFRRFHYRM